MTDVDIITSGITKNNVYNVGDYFLKIDTEQLYVIVRHITYAMSTSYSLINVKTGSAYAADVSYIECIFDGDREDFQYIDKVNITIGG